MAFALNVIVSAVVIATASWLAGRFPTRAGFLIALPLSSMLVLPMSYLEHGNLRASFILAKSIVLAVPVIMIFFLPFLMAERLGLRFWLAYGLGCVLLPVGYLLHQWLARLMGIA